MRISPRALRAETAGIALTLLATAAVTATMAPWQRQIGLLNEGLILLLWPSSSLPPTAGGGALRRAGDNLALTFFFAG